MLFSRRLTGAGAEPEEARGEHWGAHCHAGGGEARDLLAPIYGWITEGFDLLERCWMSNAVPEMQWGGYCRSPASSLILLMYLPLGWADLYCHFVFNATPEQAVVSKLGLTPPLSAGEDYRITAAYRA